MAEILLQFGYDVSGMDGHLYRPRACGRERADGMWEGWIEFESIDGKSVLRTARETTQPNRADIEYWATGLTPAYLDGALIRLLRPDPKLPLQHGPARPFFDAPAPSPASGAAPAEHVIAPRAVLDPFVVYAEGGEVLRAQLGALDSSQLRSIILAHGLSPAKPAELDAMSRIELVSTIMTAVRDRARV